MKVFYFIALPVAGIVALGVVFNQSSEDEIIDQSKIEQISQNTKKQKNINNIVYNRKNSQISSPTLQPQNDPLNTAFPPPVKTQTFLPLEQKINAWELSLQALDDTPYPVFNIQFGGGFLQELTIGRQIVLTLPENIGDVDATLSATRNDLNGVQIWEGKIADGGELEKVIISKGKERSYVVIMTVNGTFQADANNDTGKGIIFNDNEASTHLPEAQIGI